MAKTQQIETKIKISIRQKLMLAASIVVIGGVSFFWVFTSFPQKSSQQLVNDEKSDGALYLNVAALLSKECYPQCDTISRVQDIIEKKPGLDLIVTGEYSLYGPNYNSHYNEKPTPKIALNCRNNNCQLQNINGGEEVIAMIDQIKTLAANNNVNIILGTLPLTLAIKFSDGSSYVPAMYNSLVVVDRLGKIIFNKQKTKGSDSCYLYLSHDWLGCNDSDVSEELQEKSRQVALNSSKVFGLTNKSGQLFKIFTSICADYNDLEMIAQGANQNADLLVWSTANGSDMRMRESSEQIQNNNLSEFNRQQITDYFVTPFVSNNRTIKANGFVISADTMSSGNGIINLGFRPLEQLEITDDYAYGRIKVR